MDVLKQINGIGYDRFAEMGSYLVNHGIDVDKTPTIRKVFTRLSKARQYYDSLNEEKNIWSLSNGIDLLQDHRLIDTPYPPPSNKAQKE